jgi:hypothetical protein
MRKLGIATGIAAALFVLVFLGTMFTAIWATSLGLSTVTQDALANTSLVCAVLSVMLGGFSVHAILDI